MFKHQDLQMFGLKYSNVSTMEVNAYWFIITYSVYILTATLTHGIIACTVKIMLFFKLCHVIDNTKRLYYIFMLDNTIRLHYMFMLDNTKRLHYIFMLDNTKRLHYICILVSTKR